MALLLPHSVFYHIPKTGGSWVRGAIQKAGIPTNEVGVLGPVDMPLIDSRGLFLHATPQAVPLQMFAFTFVRNPLSWYQSHWAYCTKNKRWNEHNPFERQCASDNFHQFLRNALTYFPGGVSNMYRGYLGEEYTLPGGFVGRQERLVEDLILALRMAGETFDETSIRRTPPANLAARLDDFQHRCLYTAELLWEMMQSEGHAMRSLGYDREDLSCFLDQRKHSPLPATNHSTRS
ncbi:hypothetical protein A2454_01280 [Candidatus Peribacteria bacterium RIFOXYC2_FULL_55_14]|nr:MAG: hypothetical protein UY87_C0036G0008 [Candidatus Peribacteria bacterium GW2011_GWC2_54_8]OGJ72815.1 MAG: hypothetical protein A2198_00405 [Candidatus Peribacteria bacterium RIFOXYA1_FULL_56_14]OGJ73362.1 MAG: hypothetical protein A2217_01470 [Candidatus Peribacteria bacterium RIFOXYA2_FULL_55_28]OGJ74544.1 MAG: hypothetical protein A2384_02760 [Candidatus Peribacteria bacterium RIFOXYB1_FULL_54_35]OGJ77590.1 MAG: hypothetical protein A2327_05110 [Candidatus Peribacteria bacterium RIFOXY